MSYILDALVKADLERQRQGVPGLHTIQAGLMPGPGARRRWPVGVAAMAVGAGVLALAWEHWAQHPEAGATHTREPERQLPLAAAVPAVPPPVARAASPVVSRAPVAARPAAPVRDLRPEARPASVEMAAPERKTRPDSRLYTIAELPPALQQEARNITVAGFAQASDANERLAIINDRAWREGEEVRTGLKVERISSDGVILNLKGYRFRKGGA
ncbi:MAG TPA: general secretion pathway protein GspB [Rhodocyclaceae bacterium]|nr:general secretion pathway protein GspB [Rhodocyclaceae bacterium]